MLRCRDTLLTDDRQAAHASVSDRMVVSLLLLQLEASPSVCYQAAVAAHASSLVVIVLLSDFRQSSQATDKNSQNMLNSAMHM